MRNEHLVFLSVDPGEPGGDKATAFAFVAGRVHIVPYYIPQHWWDRLYVVADDKGIHWCMNGWNNGEGHAKARMGGKIVYCYRWVVEKMTGRALARHDHVDHRCERKLCITYEHLEPVTPGENTARGPGRLHQFKPAGAYE